MIDLPSAIAFMATHARVLDRRRLDLLLAETQPDAVLAALTAYRNSDGGIGWGLEPDLRSPTSQPAGALHAFDVLEELAPATYPVARELCDWLTTATLPGGGLPFSLAGADAPGSAPWWAGADPAVPSLHITSAVCAAAHRVGAHDAAVRAHPWLERATAWCMGEIAALTHAGHAYELRYVLDLLDAIADASPEAHAQLERLTGLLPPSWEAPVGGGLEDEKLRPLDFSPRPDGPLRALAPADAIAGELDRVEGGQQADGGWTVDFAQSSPAAALEWRGHYTVRAIRILHAHGRLALPSSA